MVYVCVSCVYMYVRVFSCTCSHYLDGLPELQRFHRFLPFSEICTGGDKYKHIHYKVPFSKICTGDKYKKKWDYSYILVYLARFRAIRWRKCGITVRYWFIIKCLSPAFFWDMYWRQIQKNKKYMKRSQLKWSVRNVCIIWFELSLPLSYENLLIFY